MRRHYEPDGQCELREKKSRPISALLRSSTPPTGHIEGIDLVTEGILTLTNVLDMMRNGLPSRQRLRYRVDGPSRMADLLIEGRRIHFIVGRAINPAHQSP